MTDTTVSPRLLPREERVLSPVFRTTRAGWFVIALLAAVAGIGVVAFIDQCMNGLAVTGMRDQFLWGIYITNFVFFIGISHAGTLVSAILRLTGAEWRTPITRMAEAITLFALLIGGPMVVIDMGRPDRILNVVLYGRLQSPILWDFLSVCTYFAGSLVYLYLPLIPDFAILRDQGQRLPRWKLKLYTKLALGWKGTPKQWHLLKRAIGVMAVTIVPVAVSVHTVISWIFGMTLRPGWHSTIFGPYFVVGAIFSGIGAIITAMWIFRKILHLEEYITADHFRKLGALLLTTNAAYIYFTFSEYLTSGYGGLRPEARLVQNLMFGEYSVTFWSTISIGLVIPLFLLALPVIRRKIGVIVFASILVNIGMWLKRYVIVVPTLSVPYIEPAGTATYTPTWVEWAVTIGAFAGFSLLYVLFIRVFPIISLWETREELGGPEDAAAPSEPETKGAPIGAGGQA